MTSVERSPGQAAATPNAAPTSSGYVDYQDQPLGVHFRYPSAWYLQATPDFTTLTSFDPSNPPHKLEWTDKTVSIQLGLRAFAEPFAGFDSWVESTKQEAIAQHLDIAREERFQVAGQPAARLTLVSGSGGIDNRVLTVLDGRYYVIDIQGNYPLAAEVLASIEPLASGGG